MILRPALLAAALAFSSAASAQPAPQRFAIAGHGSLLLNVPAGWRVADKALADPPAVALSMLGPSADSFNLQITAIWLEPAKRSGMTPALIRERVQATAGELLPRSVEKEPKLIELRGKQALGYYFSLTDRESANTAPDYKYIAQGTVSVGETVAIFTFLHREPDTPAKEQALRMIKEAAYVMEKAK